MGRESKTRNYIVIYEDGEIDLNIDSEFVYLGSDIKGKFWAQGDNTNLTILGDTYSPSCDKVVNGKKLYKDIKHNLVSSHYAKFDKLVREEEHAKR